MRLLLSAALIAFASPCLVPPAQAQQAQASTAEDLDILADFFLPSDAIRQMILNGCRTAYQTKRSRNAEDMALERALPGIGEKMVAASGAYCDAETPGAIARWHDAIKSDWRDSTNPADLHRLAILAWPQVRSIRAAKIEAQPGETIVATLKRTLPDASAEEARYRAEQRTLARTPHGAALINRLSAYQEHIQKRAKAADGPILTILRGALAAAHRAANDYAREKGFAEPYPGQ